MTLSAAELDRLVDAIAERVVALLAEHNSDSLLDSYGAAQILGCSVATIERRTKDGSIPSVKMGRLRRYRRTELLELSKKGGADA